jgi:LPS-assembly lipoprotein
MKINRITVLVLLLVSTAGCGYQLRGSSNLPESMKQTYVQTVKPGSPLLKEVQRVLGNSGSEVVFLVAQADAVLRITRDDMIRRVLTVSDTTRVQEFMLDYHVEFRVTDAAGKVLVPNQELELHQAFEFSDTQVLGKSGQEEILSQEMHREMAALIMDRISASARG